MVIILVHISLTFLFMLTELEDREHAAAQERVSEVTAAKNLEAEVTLLYKK